MCQVHKRSKAPLTWDSRNFKKTLIYTPTTKMRAWESRLHTHSLSNSHISAGVERWRAAKLCVWVACQSRVPRDVALKARHFGWLVYAGCAHTHTAHWACCYYANRVISHALPIQQTPPLPVLINQRDPRLCDTLNKHWRMHAWKMGMTWHRYHKHAHVFTYCRVVRDGDNGSISQKIAW